MSDGRTTTAPTFADVNRDVLRTLEPPGNLYFAWMCFVALLLPSTFVFEGMRSALRTSSVDPSLLAAAFALNLLYLGAGAAFFGWMLGRVREKGYLGRLGME